MQTGLCSTSWTYTILLSAGDVFLTSQSWWYCLAYLVRRLGWSGVYDELVRRPEH